VVQWLPRKEEREPIYKSGMMKWHVKGGGNSLLR
jgi:hypothetical protein